MSKSSAADSGFAEFGADDFNSRDTAEMTVSIGGNPTTWKWTFAGPGHERTIAQTERLARERLQESRAQQQAQINGRKWKAPDQDVDEVRAANIKWIVERLLGWSPVKIGGVELPFTAEAATDLLADPKKPELLAQALEFLTADDSFTKRSAKT